MFHPLPAETVLEARQRTRRATFLLFLLLVALYIFFADLLSAVTYLFIEYKAELTGSGNLGSVLLVSTLVAAAVAVAHFLLVRTKSLDDLLTQIPNREADRTDKRHVQFINLVGEAEAATGIHGIRALVLPTPGCNAFSIQDGRGRSAIGVTEGLLSKLSRVELSAVVAHEAAHLVHEDSKLVTTACFLFSVFGKINETLGSVVTRSSYSGRRSSSKGGNLAGLILVLWLVSGLGYLVTKLVSMAISREREYEADSDGVAMCKDPLALAESLYKISHRYRGDMPGAFSALFIMNPGESALDDQEGSLSDLFSNHPPVSKRLAKLLTWAKSDLKTLQEKTRREQEKEEKSRASRKEGPAPAEKSFMAYKDNQWVGPYDPMQLLSLGMLDPSAWICQAGTQEVKKASEAPELLPLLENQVQGAVSKNACPRCKTPLVLAPYEDAELEQCGFCKGYLLKAGVLERIISREEEAFSPEETAKAKLWRDSRRGPLKDRDEFPEIQCPLCQSPMGKGIHSMLTQVVIDRCTKESCRAIWCDGGELETIQILIEDAHKSKPR
jgi:heat shock protein HtpX